MPKVPPAPIAQAAFPPNRCQLWGSCVSSWRLMFVVVVVVFKFGRQKGNQREAGRGRLKMREWQRQTEWRGRVEKK